jgi:hypothetical protein
MANKPMNSDIKMISMGCKPDPTKFEIIKLKQCYGCTIIEAKYDGCKTFNGHKLMLLKGYHNKEDLETLDPHFLDEDYAVVARFIPNDMGWRMAIECTFEVP